MRVIQTVQLFSSYKDHSVEGLKLGNRVGRLPAGLTCSLGRALGVLGDPRRALHHVLSL